MLMPSTRTAPIEFPTGRKAARRMVSLVGVTPADPPVPVGEGRGEGAFARRRHCNRLRPFSAVATLLKEPGDWEFVRRPSPEPSPRGRGGRAGGTLTCLPSHHGEFRDVDVYVLAAVLVRQLDQKVIRLDLHAIAK